MLNRVFKTIFILSLCLGMILPVNAGNVDVSDGSAFITKSEMSYQLNTLSNRMTQLENSLDSKIDKLVSSYLTRNGIWNGAKQKLVKNFTDSWYHFTSANDWNSSRLNYPAYKDYSYWSYPRKSTTEGSLPFCTSSKSGLMYITMEIVGNLYNRAYAVPNTYDGPSAGAGSLLWKFYKNGQIASSVKFGGVSSIVNMGGEDYIQRNIGIFDQKLYTLFFVNKDDVLTYDIVLSVMWGAPKTWSSWSTGMGGPDVSVGGDAYVISCEIY